MRSKFKRKSLSAAIVAALGLMVFASYALGALENLSNGGVAGNFRVAGSLALSVGRTFTGTQNGHGQLLVPGRNLTILCKKGKLETGSKVLAANEALLNVLFEECTATNTAGAALPCTVKSSGQSVGNVLASAIALPKLHETAVGVNSLYILFEPDGVAGTFFTTILLEGAECALPKTNNISGSVVALLDNGNEAVSHLLSFSEAIQKLFQVGELGDHLKFGTFESYIDAHVIEVKINDATHEGKLWSVE